MSHSPEQIDVTDPVIDEIRAVRHLISERCGHDPERLAAYYMTIQERYRHRLHAPRKDSRATVAE